MPRRRGGTRTRVGCRGQGGFVGLPATLPEDRETKHAHTWAGDKKIVEPV